MSAEQKLREALDRSFAEADRTRQELSQMCYSREDFPVDLALTFHRGIQRLWSAVESHHAAIGRLLEPPPDEMIRRAQREAWPHVRFVQAYQNWLIGGDA